MSQPPLVLAMLALVWLFSLAGGAQLIRNAFREQRSAKGGSRLGAAYREARFRLRLAAGIALLLWVFSGVLWLATHP